jgi:predicted AlkP superfamily pyrophosphatase or phosphodiesterase
LSRYRDRFGEGGFRHLLENGAVYANAHYQHANTETIVGHATLATGASPAQHGMIGNVWFDREAGELAYNIEDAEHPILPTRREVLEGAQLDPTQKAARTKGRSPRSLLASTFSDELFIHTAGGAKVFGVSGKDRSAVSMAGHVGKAFWYSTDSGDMVTSNYYYEAYPEWVVEWNARRQAETHAGGAWTLLNETSSYLLAASDDRPYETDLRGYGRVFPHPFGKLGDPLFFTRLFVSPVGDALAADFAKTLVIAEQLGRDATPDYLSISFSSVDAVNHFFGPSSLENEDAVLQLDRTLADLFDFIDETIGLEHTLIVLSADHGMPEMPEAMAEAGLSAGRLYSDDVVNRANEAAHHHFGIENAVRFFFRPYLYLEREKIHAAGADPDEVEQEIAVALTDMDGIALAVAQSALPTLADTDLIARIRRNSHPSRSGDIYVVQAPYWFLFEKGPVAVMHGSPWRYDSYVPILFAGPGIEPQTLYRRVHPADVAPTLSGYLGVKPPSSAVGRPLKEVLR